MNDQRFKELLNLHLDHRLTAGEARELEDTLRTDPARAKTFRAYQRMQAGCSALFQRSAADAPAPQALVLALRQAEDRMRAKAERREVVIGWGTWGATAGVAALVALVVARVSQPGLHSVRVAEADASPAEPRTVAQRVTSAPVSAAVISSTVAPQGLPQHLTLAALGITAEAGDTAALSRWQTTEESLARVALAQSEAPGWMQNAPSASTAWPGSTATHFGTQRINAWGGQGGGATFQTVGYTFER
jgi:hypothetical protein